MNHEFESMAFRFMPRTRHPYLRHAALTPRGKYSNILRKASQTSLSHEQQHVGTCPAPPFNGMRKNQSPLSASRWQT
jgi:hypothetical protein